MAVKETREVLADAKRHQTPANEQPAGDRFRMMFSNLPGPAHHFRDDLLIGEVPIGLALGQDMPEDNKQTSGNGNDRLALFQAVGKAGEFFFPIGIGIDAGSGGLPGLTRRGRR
jgi:hypothetical protein